MPARTTAITTRFAGSPPAALTFLRRLRRHNEREWVEAHRPEYEQLLRSPMREFLEEFDVLLAGTLVLEHHREFATILGATSLSRRFGPLSDEAMLVRPPRGVDPDHPAADWLRYKSFTVSRPVADAVMTSPALLTELGRDLRTLAPLVRWLNDALGFAPASRR